MDDNMEVDDLFGDNAGMENAAMDAAMHMPIPTSLKGLPQRLHELHTNGCSQTIAWSKTGCLAYIAPDGMSVKFAFLSCDPSNGRWTLKEDVNMDKPITNDGKHPFVSILWSSTLMDLAIADAAGRITIGNHSYMALNSFNMLHRAAEDHENDLNRPVGMYWLNRDRPSLWFLPTSKDNNWTYLPTKRIPHGPHHNLALAIVTKSGNFRLLYQQANGAFKTASASLQRISSSGELVTHAAMGSMRDGSLLLAMQTYDRKLHVFRVRIEWAPEKGQQENIRQANIHVEHIRQNVSGGIFKEPSNELLGEATPPSYSTLNLSHLEIIQTSDIEKTEQRAPIILAVYSTSLNSIGMPNNAHASPSVVVRWQLSISEQKLHPSFDEIGAKTGEAKPKRRFEITRLDDVHLSQAVVSVQDADNGLIAFVLGDGSISFHDSAFMLDQYQQQEFGKASSLARAGFAFQGAESETDGLHVALSQNGVVAVSVNSAGKLHCRNMKMWQIIQNDEDRQLGIETALHALSLVFARACFGTTATDDILKIVMEELRDHETAFAQIVYRSLFVDSDFTTSLDQLAKKTFIPKVLSMQASFGTGTQRNVSSAFCWTTLNIRHISLHLLLILTYLKQNGGVEYRDPDVLSAVLHNINYAQSLFAYLLNNLFEIAHPTFPTPPSSPGNMEPSHAELTTLLFLSSWSRFFLRHVSRALRGLTIAHQSGSAVNPKALPAFTRIAREIDPSFMPNSSSSVTGEPASPVKMEAVERLIVGIDKYVANAYEAAGVTTDAQKAAIEREMLTQAKVPEVLAGVIPRVVKEILPITRTEVNRLDVWEGEYNWLGIWSQARPFVDVHKKRPIKCFPKDDTRSDQKVRKCVRCGEISEDLTPGRGLPPYFRQHISRCVCEANFLVERRQ